MKLRLFVQILTIIIAGFQTLYAGPENNSTEPTDESTGSSAGTSAPPGNILGTVLDDKTDKPVQFATVGVYNASDSSLVNGAISDDKGRFRIGKLTPGDYYVDIRFIGYRNERINKLRIEKDQPGINMGSIGLEQATENIKGVDVVAEQPSVEYKIDKKVISVSQAVSSAGGSAVDVLETAPSITTDVNGDVLLRGSSSFTVLIDGKPSVLEGSDALRQVPVSTIQNIEIITNPSAKYDPEGSAGIINVVTKKNRQQGINGLTTASLFNTGEYRLDVNLSRRVKKLNFTGGLSLNNRPNPNDWYRYRKTNSGDTTRYMIGDGNWTWKRAGERMQFGADYFASDRTTISAYGNIGHFQWRYDNPANFHEYTVPSSVEKYFRQQSGYSNGTMYYNLNTNFSHKFDDKGHEITGYIDFSNMDGNADNEAYEMTTDAGWNLVGDLPLRQRGDESSSSRQLEAKLDYTRPLGSSSKLEAGYQGSYDIGSQHNTWEVYDPDLAEWISQPDKESRLDNTKNIQGIYALFSNQNRILDFQAGLRTEYTDRIITQTTTGVSTRINRLDFFPTLNLSKKFTGNNQLQASYSRRIRRPRSWQLDPYPRYNDPSTRWMGNPALEPEYTNSWELNYIKTFGKNFFSLETYYRKTINDINHVVNYDPELDLTIQTFDNLNEKYEVGTEAAINTDILKWWNIMLSADLYRQRIDATNIDSKIQHANSWQAKFDNSFKFRWGTRIQLSSRYYGPSIRAQGYRKAFFVANLGVRQAFLNRKLMMTFMVRDLFRTHQHEDVVDVPEQYQVTRFRNQSPVFGINLSYTLNNFRQRNNSDEIQMDFSEGGYQ